MNNNIRVQHASSFLSKSLLLWETVGYDSVHGGYMEGLDFASTPLHNSDKRFRIHPRNIFSHTVGTLWGYYDGLQVAEQAFSDIITQFWLPSGGFATKADSTNTIIDKAIKTYDHTFVLLSLAWLYKATHKPIYKQWLQKVWEFMKEHLQNQDGSFINGLDEQGQPTQDAIPRLQNPHMHLLEAMLSIVEVFDIEPWKREARKLFSLFSTHIVDTKKGYIQEFFNEDWTPDAHKGHLIEPGHHFEWIWILQKYEMIMNTQIPFIDTIYQFIISQGINSYGMGYDQMDIEGNPTTPITYRMWVQIELLKAHIAMFRRSQDLQYIHNANLVFDILFKHYIIYKQGIWYDTLNKDLTNITPFSPASTLYHIIIACNEYIQCIQSL